MFKINVGGVPEHFNYPWIECIENNIFKEAGFDVEWQDCPGGTGEMSTALENKSIDIAIMLTEGSLKKIKTGKSFKIIQKYIESPLLWGIHVNAESHYTKIEDLEGKKAAISQFNSGSHLMTYVLADKHSWNLDQLEFKVCNTLNGAIEALKNKEADFLLWERYTTKPYVDDHILKHLGNCPTPWPCFVIVSRENYYKQHKVKVENLLQVLNKKTKELKDHQDIVDILSERYRIKQTDVKEWLTKTEWSNSSLKPETISELKLKLKKYSIIS
jgi:ABC-type nitrate/sulfonate/bicarbonate transport system substrate-binding protein